MSNVFVVDTDKQPLTPVHPGRARWLLNAGEAAVFKRFPFTIILLRAVKSPQGKPLRIKIDPGSCTTGIALVDDANGAVVFAAELSHRGKAIKKSLDDRRAVRRSRRTRHTRYRKPRFQNRTRRNGWVAPSLESRVCNITTWVKRLMRLCPIGAISMELVRFDTQAMDNPDIEGCQYQQGTLAGYELREYMLDKWGRTCAYCSKQNIPLQIEHIVPRAKGGTDRVSNLTLACARCNLAKGAQDVTVFLKKKPDVLKRILTQTKAPLKDAAVVNGTRWTLYERLKALGLPIECGSGGRTKFNRTMRRLPKSHYLDAACVGASTPETLTVKGITPLLITATGHGCRQMCLMSDTGFPRTKPKQKQFTHGFRTGDMVRALVPVHLKNAGVHVGRMSAKASGGFSITTCSGIVTDIGKKYCRRLQQADGYGYLQCISPTSAFLSSRGSPERIFMAKKDRVPVTGQFGRGADAFFGPATKEEEKRDTGIPVQQEAVKPVSQQDSTRVEQFASEMVNQDTSRQTNKSEFMKATYYITPEQDMKLERLRLARREHGVKVDKSALIREAIDQLRD